MDRHSPELSDESIMRAAYEKAKEKNDVWDFDEEDEDAYRLAIMSELADDSNAISLDKFDEVFDKELGAFLKNKYDYIRDMKDAYKNSLNTNAEQRIFKTIPDHVFWDIKTPRNKGQL